MRRGHHVAAGGQAEVGLSSRERRGGAVHRPALDHAAGVEDRRRGPRRRRRRTRPGPLAEGEDLGHVGRAVGRRDLAAAEPARHESSR